MYSLKTLFFSSILDFIFSPNQGGSWSLNDTVLFGMKFEKILINVELKKLTCPFIGKLVKEPSQLILLMALFIPLI